jgi:hypothetical protein
VSTIDQILRRAINPFDPATFKPGNFWYELQEPMLHVEAIHAHPLQCITDLLQQIQHDHRTRSLLLEGDSGSGKSHLLGRLKRSLLKNACFVYIDPFPESDSIWRHVLRYTVDSLVQIPEGGTESQLLRWFKGLPIFQTLSTDWSHRGRVAVIRHLRDRYPSGIYNANEFLGVLYDLLNPDWYPLACDWLRGDDLDEEGLSILGVQRAIATEQDAQGILANLGRIAADTQPMVLCFDQLDNIARTDEGRIDLQAIFNVNSTLHNCGLKNFLIIISIITSTWRQNSYRIPAADQARLDAQISLPPISLDQAAALWQSRLYPLHQQADPRPESAIYPFTFQILEQKFPGGKTHPRNALELGRRLLQNYKTGTTRTNPNPSKPLVEQSEAIAAFRLVWRQEFEQSQDRIQRIRQFASPELIQMLKELLQVVHSGELRSRLLPSPTYASHSFSFEIASVGRVGIVWNEDPNLTSFYHVMNACRRTVSLGLCQKLWLIRSEGIGRAGNQGHEFYGRIFTDTPHHHIQPSLNSVQHLATYHRLVNAAASGELVVAGTTPTVSGLEALMRDAKLLQECELLWDLGLLNGRRPQRRRSSSVAPSRTAHADIETGQLQTFLMDLIKTHQLLGRQILVQKTLSQFPHVTDAFVHQGIDQLSASAQVHVLGEPDQWEEQLICIVQ